MPLNRSIKAVNHVRKLHCIQENADLEEVYTVLMIVWTSLICLWKRFTVPHTLKKETYNIYIVYTRFTVFHSGSKSWSVEWNVDPASCKHGARFHSGMKSATGRINTEQRMRVLPCVRHLWNLKFTQFPACLIPETQLYNSKHELKVSFNPDRNSIWIHVNCSLH